MHAGQENQYRAAQQRAGGAGGSDRAEYQRHDEKSGMLQTGAGETPREAGAD